MNKSTPLSWDDVLSAGTVLASIQASGIPDLIRRKFGLKTSDLIIVVETDKGLLLNPAQVGSIPALDTVGSALRRRGITLESLIESGRKIRSDLVKERYGLTDANA